MGGPTVLGVFNLIVATCMYYIYIYIKRYIVYLFTIGSMYIINHNDDII